jgi:hypothetical protein
MSQANNADNIAFTTAFGVDKLFDQTFSGSFNVGAASFPPFNGNVATTAISHSYGANVLPLMQWSNNGTTWYDGGTMRFTLAAFLDPNFTATCYTTSTQIVVVGQNFTGSTQTCHYRIRLISGE